MKVIKGPISSPFGRRQHPIEGAYKIHQGIDIAAPIGTPIFSPTKGIISSIYSHPKGGLTLTIRSECNTIRYAMCHLNSVEAQEGDTVRIGQKIAHSGNSGRSTGPHLHYSVKTGGKWRGEQYIGGTFTDSAKYLDIEI